MELTQKGEMVSRLQAKASQIGKILNNLEKYNHLVAKEPAPKPAYKRPLQNFQLKPLEKPTKLELSSNTKDKLKSVNVTESVCTGSKSSDQQSDEQNMQNENTENVENASNT